MNLGTPQEMLYDERDYNESPKDMTAEEFEGSLLDISNENATERYLMNKYEFAEAYHKAKVEAVSKNMYKTIWQTAVNLGFKFNETDAHEMTLEIKKQLLKQ